MIGSFLFSYSPEKDERVSSGMKAQGPKRLYQGHIAFYIGYDTLPQLGKYRFKPVQIMFQKGNPKAHEWRAERRDWHHTNAGTGQQIVHKPEVMV